MYSIIKATFKRLLLQRTCQDQRLCFDEQNHRDRLACAVAFDLLTEARVNFRGLELQCVDGKILEFIAEISEIERDEILIIVFTAIVGTVLICGLLVCVFGNSKREIIIIETNNKCSRWTRTTGKLYLSYLS